MPWRNSARTGVPPKPGGGTRPCQEAGLLVKPGWPLRPECKSLEGRHRHRKVRHRRLREGRAKVDPQDDGRRRKGRYYRDSAAQDPTALQDVKVRSPTAMRQVMVWHGSLRPLTSKPHPPVIWWSRCVIKDLVIVSEFGPMDQPNSVDRGSLAKHECRCCHHLPGMASQPRDRKSLRVKREQDPEPEERGDRDDPGQAVPVVDVHEEEADQNRLGRGDQQRHGKMQRPQRQDTRPRWSRTAGPAGRRRR